MEAWYLKGYIAYGAGGAFRFPLAGPVNRFMWVV
jgi:hypothetical protein